ncbi:hypothetical protein [Desulfosediminicola sp.]|uniref:hypothetical protein n=1 Tax=Desulfosediminicola sp. TaxID=2886825 RepID=UPI003AF24370
MLQVLKLNIKVYCILAWFFVLFGSNPGHAFIFGPSNYDECISEYTKEAESNRAVTIIAHACRYKFKEKGNQKYSDCIFDYAPGVLSDRAATIIAHACRYKYIERSRIKYANCILDEVPEVKTDRAATIVAHTCKNKYP